MTKRELARETKRLAGNPNARLQVTEYGRGYNAYLTYTNEWFQDDPDERTIGFITEPMTNKQVNEWILEKTTAWWDR